MRCTCHHESCGHPIAPKNRRRFKRCLSEGTRRVQVVLEGLAGPITLLCDLCAKTALDTGHFREVAAS